MRPRPTPRNFRAIVTNLRGREEFNDLIAVEMASVMRGGERGVIPVWNTQRRMLETVHHVWLCEWGEIERERRVPKRSDRRRLPTVRGEPVQGRFDRSRGARLSHAMHALGRRSQGLLG